MGQLHTRSVKSNANFADYQMAPPGAYPVTSRQLAPRSLHTQKYTDANRSLVATL
jgi:hypothetical protein